MIWITLLLLKTLEGGLHKPVDKHQLVVTLYGHPCDCREGKGQIPSTTTDCGDQMAYLAVTRLNLGESPKDGFVGRNQNLCHHLKMTTAPQIANL